MNLAFYMTIIYAAACSCSLLFLLLYNIPLYKYSTVYWFILLKVRVKVAQSCPTLCNSMDCTVHWNSPGQNTGVGILSRLQGIFLTWESNPGLLHCRHILYQLSHKGSLKGRQRPGVTLMLWLGFILLLSI